MDSYYYLILILGILLVLALIGLDVYYKRIEQLKEIIRKLESKNRDLMKLNKVIEDYNKNLEDIAFKQIVKTRYDKLVGFLHKLKNRILLLIKRVKKHL
jgi:predicted PurR-regulated permease PerM